MEEIKREYLSTERSPVIDPELRDLLPPITDAEREALTADILKNGCYSPMICMEDMTLVDGHHRYGICTEHDIPYRMVVLDFEDKLDAKEWMVNTQKGRRNLSVYQLGQIALKLKPEFETRAKANMAAGGGDKVSEDARAGFLTSENPLAQSVNTTKELADSVGIGTDTMNKVIQIEESAPAPIKEALAKDLVSVNKAYGMTKKLKDMPEEEREEAAKELLRQDEEKQYRKIDADSAIAKAVNDAIYKTSKVDSSEQAVRLWIEYCCVEDISLRRDLQLAQMAAENMQNIYLHDIEVVQGRLSDFFRLYAENDMKPTVAGMAIALNGMSRRTLWAITHDAVTGSSGYKSALPQDVALVIKKAYFLLENLWETYMNSGKINPMAGVFLGVNNYGYQDVKKVDIAPVMPEDKENDYDPEDIRRRYLIDSNDSDSENE